MLSLTKEMYFLFKDNEKIVDMRVIKAAVLVNWFGVREIWKAQLVLSKKQVIEKAINSETQTRWSLNQLASDIGKVQSHIAHFCYREKY